MIFSHSLAERHGGLRQLLLTPVGVLVEALESDGAEGWDDGNGVVAERMSFDDGRLDIEAAVRAPPRASCTT